MIRDTLFTCPVLGGWCTSFQGIPTVNDLFTVGGGRFVHPFAFSQGVADTFGLTRTERFVHPFGEVVICHPIDDGMFCPVTEMLSCIGTASIPKAHFGHSVLFWN